MELNVRVVLSYSFLSEGTELESIFLWNFFIFLLEKGHARALKNTLKKYIKDYFFNTFKYFRERQSLYYQGLQRKYIPFLYVIYTLFVRHLYLFCTSFIPFLYVIYTFFVRHLYLYL
uniref:Uncharacterized protein n=2 Tax=Lactobacillaceae TaxID=33958 RepID=A0A285PJ51_9LACO|nr:hypothetical protein PLAC3_P08 [Ligilactobacillus acidipiscis]SPM00131.1 hypothetical protein PLAC03_P08 [Ligilactobacillus acidipiscis]